MARHVENEVQQRAARDDVRKELAFDFSAGATRKQVGWQDPRELEYWASGPVRLRLTFDRDREIGVDARDLLFDRDEDDPAKVRSIDIECEELSRNEVVALLDTLERDFDAFCGRNPEVPLRDAFEAWTTDSTDRVFTAAGRDDFPVVDLRLFEDAALEGRYAVDLTFSDLRPPLPPAVRAAFDAFDRDDQAAALRTIEANSDVDWTLTGPVWGTALHRAAQKGWRDVAAALLAQGVDADVPDESGERPLAVAVRRGHLDLAEDLLAAGADVNAARKGGTTILHDVAERRYVLPQRVAIAWLLERGADRSLRNSLGRTPLDLARRREHEEAIAILQESARP